MQYQVNDSLKDKLVFLRVGFLFLIAVFFVLGLRFVFLSPEKFDLKSETPQVVQEVKVPVVEVIPTTMPTPSQIVYKIKVVNSTGQTGLASKTVQSLKNKGVKVEATLENGQAKDGMEVIYSDSIKDGDYLKNSLKEMFSSAKVTEDKQDFDVVISIGK